MTGQDGRQQPEAADNHRQPARETWLSTQLRNRIQRALGGDQQHGGRQVHEPEPLPPAKSPDPSPPDLEAEP